MGTQLRNLEASGAGQKYKGPIWTLLILAPMIAEVLSGSTRTSILFVLIPEVMVWGVGALVARDLVRRWKGGSLSLLLLGLALSVGEEFIIQQTSIAPLPFPGAHADYGRIAGINLVYLLFMLGYESVWVVVVPVQVSELIFPQCREGAWLRRKGWIGCTIAFLIGSRIAWYGWTQQARPRLGAAPYHPPAGMIVGGMAAIVLLIALAYALRNSGHPSAAGRTVPAWVAGIVAFGMGAAWFELIGQVFVPNPMAFQKATGAGIGWGVIALLLFSWWSGRQAWSDVHRFCACWGATLACQSMPYYTIRTWTTVDVVGKVVFDALALAMFIWLGRRVLQRDEAVKSFA
ncbi:MAG TPA: hypothetical protein VHZ28_03090 [Terracidiphilus sp.]|jgi:hypothetical protein|nr:hypothetical protein [Terracidiphilus sp.]